MSNKKINVFPFGLITLVIGWTIYKDFDFETLSFEKPALAVVYILTFLMCVFFIVKNLRDKE